MSCESYVRKRSVRILYTNHRQETAWRLVMPLKLWFGATQWHPEEQWLLDALDLDKDAERSFAVRDIHGWHPLDEPAPTEDA